MEETISLQEIFEVIKKRLMLIILFVLGAALVAAVVSYFLLTPTYEASAKFIVNQGQQDPNMQYSVNDIRTNFELINTYSDIIESTAISDDVVTELDLTITPQQLANKINVSSQDNSQVVTVTATDTNPNVAVQLANTTVTVFQSKLPDLMNVDNVNVLTPAVLPADPQPVAPNPTLNIAIAIVLGGMLGVGLAFLLEYLDKSISTEEDVSRHLDIPVFGVISHMDNSDIRGSQMQKAQQKKARKRGAVVE